MTQDSSPKTSDGSAASASQAASFDQLLGQCQGLMLGRLEEAFSAMLDKTDETLSNTTGESAASATLIRETRDKLLSQRETFQNFFRTRCQAEFRKRGGRVKAIGASFSELDLSALDLELVGEDDLNESLQFNDQAAKLREYCEDDLSALDQRVGVLLGNANLNAEDNPFAPQAVLDAYKQACRQFESSVEARTVLLRLFDDHVLDAIRAIYKSMNALLVENSILPKIRRSPSQRKDRPSAPDLPPGKDFFSVLQDLIATNVQQVIRGGVSTGGAPALASTPAGTMGPGYGNAPGAPVLQGAELLGSLTRIQVGDLSGVQGLTAPATGAEGVIVPVNVLHELKGSSLGSGMSQIDITTLDIVAMMFDQIFDDPKISVGAKSLIGRLQIPMLKSAIADKALFSDATHPARRLLDALGEISQRLPADFNVSHPLFENLETILRRLIEGFKDDLGMFDTAREQVEAMAADQDRRAEDEAQSAATQVEQKETLGLGKAVAQAEIKMRIRHAKLPREVLDFLVRHWIKYLLIVQVKHGEKSDEWKGALATMDLLIDSTQPRDSAQERREIMKNVPGLLKQITEGLAAAGIEDSVRLTFFSELRRIQAGLLTRAKPADPTAPEIPAVTTTPAATEAPAQTANTPMAFTLDLLVPTAPKEAVKPAPASDSSRGSESPAPVSPEEVAFTPAITVSNPFGGGEVEVDDLDFTMAGLASAAIRKSGTDDATLLSMFKVGQWARLFSGRGPELLGKLSFVSPLKTRFLFVDRQGKTLAEYPAAEMAKKIREGQVVLTDPPTETPLFERAMGGLVDKLGGRPPPPATKAGRVVPGHPRPG